MRTSLKRRFGKAFTLIELLIVITIIGILAVALIPRVTAGPAKARDVKRKSDVQNIGTALELYYGDNDSYPSATTGGCADTVIGSTLDDYTQAISTDPMSTNTNLGGCTGKYFYKSLGTGDTAFALVAHLGLAASGDNIYCNVADGTITTEYSGTLSALAPLAAPTTACTAGQAYYVIVR